MGGMVQVDRRSAQEGTCECTKGKLLFGSPRRRRMPATEGEFEGVGWEDLNREIVGCFSIEGVHPMKCQRWQAGEKKRKRKHPDTTPREKLRERD